MKIGFNKGTGLLITVIVLVIAGYNYAQTNTSAGAALP